MLRLCILFFLLPLIAQSNDGAYYGSGNQLIPIFETDISVQKEILTIKKRSKDFIEVTVYYEFFNPKKEKEILVGFEAFAPDGDVNITPRLGRHPYMTDFTVMMNGAHLGYDIAYLEDSIVTDNDNIKSLDLRTLTGDNSYPGQFYYVYNFKAKFKKGINKIVHTYTYRLSTSVDNHFSFEYILTAANSWSNKQIDDFTLILDLGEYQQFNLGKTFFNTASEWTINGLGKMTSAKKQKYEYRDFDHVNCILQNGNLIFQKLNFSPKGEIYIWLQREWAIQASEEGYKPSIPYSYYYQNQVYNPDASDLEKKIMRNLPFARRGYIFKNEAIQSFYTKQSWYIPNPSYNSDTQTLHPLELEWLAKFKQ